MIKLSHGIRLHIEQAELKPDYEARQIVTNVMMMIAEAYQAKDIQVHEITSTITNIQTLEAIVKYIDTSSLTVMRAAKARLTKAQKDYRKALGQAKGKDIGAIRVIRQTYVRILQKFIYHHRMTIPLETLQATYLGQVLVLSGFSQLNIVIDREDHLELHARYTGQHDRLDELDVAENLIPEEAVRTYRSSRGYDYPLSVGNVKKFIVEGSKHHLFNDQRWYQITQLFKLSEELMKEEHEDITLRVTTQFDNGDKKVIDIYEDVSGVGINLHFYGLDELVLRYEAGDMEAYEAWLQFMAKTIDHILMYHARTRQDILEASFVSMKSKALTFAEDVTAKISSAIKGIIKEYVDGIRTLVLRVFEIRRDGEAQHNYQEIMHDLFKELPAVIVRKPADLPVKEQWSDEDIERVPAYTIQMKNGVDIELTDEEAGTTVMSAEFDKQAYGRTLEFRGEESIYMAKFNRAGEAISDLVNEFNMMRYIKAKKETQEWALQGYYPTARIKVGKIAQANMPQPIVELIESLTTQKGPLSVKVVEGYYVFMMYEIEMKQAADEIGSFDTEWNPYYTYLNDPSLKKEAFMKALQVNINDRLVLARHGLFDTEMIELFHEMRDERAWDWMVEPIRNALTGRQPERSAT